jgi:predicted CXXCH cytochrome family protein
MKLIVATLILLAGVARADVTNQLAVSIHAQLKCADCHAVHAAAFPDKRAIAELCASCHADVRKMNPYGLPTDQLERYKTSKHGEQLFGHDDQKVAVCTDCHGVHDILKAKSPQARTYPSNVPATCGRCHSDDKLMSQYKLPADVVDQYRTSYHAHMVLEKGDLSAPTCVTCHGNHGATPPGTVEVGQVCGKCHGRQRDLFEKSPHAEPAKAGLFNECVSCHGNHAIQKASVELFGKACVQCHASDPKQLALRDQIVGMIESSKGTYDRAKLRVDDATVRGLATEDEQLLLQEAKTQITQLEAVQHVLKLEELRPAATHAEDIVAEILRDVNHLEVVERWKRHALVPIWIFLGVMAVIFWAKRRQLS